MLGNVGNFFNKKGDFKCIKLEEKDSRNFLDFLSVCVCINDICFIEL